MIAHKNKIFEIKLAYIYDKFKNYKNLSRTQYVYRKYLNTANPDLFYHFLDLKCPKIDIVKN
jgi:hypothetical protein